MGKEFNFYRICYFGHFDPEYSRNRILIKGFKENGFEVFLCNYSSKPSWVSGFKLIKKLLSLKGNFDFLMVGYSDARRDVLLAKMFTRRLVVWDAFYSLYDSWIWDRKLALPKSLKAFYYWFLDWLNCKLSGRILLDTAEHIDYFIKEFSLKKAKFIKVLVGTDPEFFQPVDKKDNSVFTVGFWGKFIPLQGIEFIVKAAKILEANIDIKFKILGSGQEFGKVKKLAEGLKINNFEFLPRVEYKELPQFIASLDVCLGIFGQTLKTQRVIPNKIYEAIAMAKPVITAETPAIRELFTNKEDILLCRASDPEDLAAKILQLKSDSIMREKIAQNGYRLFESQCRPRHIVERLLLSLNI